MGIYNIRGGGGAHMPMPSKRKYDIIVNLEQGSSL